MVCKIEEGLPGYGERGTLAAESQKLETDRKQSMELNGQGWDAEQKQEYERKHLVWGERLGVRFPTT